MLLMWRYRRTPCPGDSTDQRPATKDATPLLGAECGVTSLAYAVKKGWHGTVVMQRVRACTRKRKYGSVLAIAQILESLARITKHVA